MALRYSKCKGSDGRPSIPQKVETKNHETVNINQGFLCYQSVEHDGRITRKPTLLGIILISLIAIAFLALAFHFMGWAYANGLN